MVKLKHLLVAFAVAGLVVGSASATIIDYGPFGVNIGSVGGAGGSDIYAQSFIAPADNVLILAGMYLQGGGSDPPEVRLDIWANDAQGWPDENNIVVAGTVYQQDFPDLTLVTTATNAPLVAGDTYWVVINGMIDQTSSGSYMGEPGPVPGREGHLVERHGWDLEQHHRRLGILRRDDSRAGHAWPAGRRRTAAAEPQTLAVASRLSFRGKRSHLAVGRAHTCGPRPVAHVGSVYAPPSLPTCAGTSIPVSIRSRPSWSPFTSAVAPSRSIARSSTLGLIKRHVADGR